MLSPELLDALDQLSHTDKLLVIQRLVGQVAQEAGAIIDFSIPYEIWSPQITPEGLEGLTKLLRSAQDEP